VYNEAMHILALMVLGLMVVGLAVLLAGMVVYGYFMLRNRTPFVVLPAGAMDAVARRLGVGDRDTVYDLGCGDGRVLLALRALNSHARYLGVENNWVVWLLARRRLRGKARLVRGEISRLPLGEATRVYVYLGPQLMAELEPRFARELPPGARVVSIQFPLPTRPADAVVELPRSRDYAARLYVYNY